MSNEFRQRALFENRLSRFGLHEIYGNLCRLIVYNLNWLIGIPISICTQRIMPYGFFSLFLYLFQINHTLVDYIGVWFRWFLMGWKLKNSIQYKSCEIINFVFAITLDIRSIELNIDHLYYFFLYSGLIPKRTSPQNYSAKKACKIALHLLNIKSRFSRGAMEGTNQTKNNRNTNEHKKMKK